MKWNSTKYIAARTVVVLLALVWAPLRLRAQNVSVDPAKMPRIATVDERFQSFNIEMAEVTGGRLLEAIRRKGEACAGITSVVAQTDGDDRA